MVNIDISATAAYKIDLLSRAWNMTDAETVDRLLAEFESRPRRSSQAEHSGETPNTVAVHASYQGVAAQGRYDSLAGSLEIIDGPGAGRVFRTPSAAAIAVVSAVNPSVNPNRNGWNFWVITATGERLQRLRPTGR